MGKGKKNTTQKKESPSTQNKGTPNKGIQSEKSSDNKKLEEEILLNERVQEKIEEYKALKEKLEQENMIKKNGLEAQYQKLKEEIITQYEAKNKMLQIEKQNLEAKKEAIKIERDQMIEEIKSDETTIRGTYKIELQQSWEREYEEKRASLDQEILDAQESIKQLHNEAIEQINKQKEETHALKILAEQEKCRLLDEARCDIEKKYEHMTKGFEKQFNELLEKENILKREQKKLQIEKEDFEIDQEGLEAQKESLKAKLESCSPVKLEELKDTIQTLESLREYDRNQNMKLKEEILHLKQFVTGDETRSIEAILSEVEHHQLQNRHLKDQLANMPSSLELDDLRSKAQMIEILSEKLEDEHRQRIEAEQKANNLSVGVLELEQNKRLAEALKTINAQLQDELKEIHEMHKQNTQSKFPGLLEIDKKLEDEPSFRPAATNLSLEQLVEYIRNYGAKREKLYYSRETIRSFIASLSASKLLILQGLSGTGKSSLPRLFKEALGVSDVLVPVQPSWRDNRELLGYDNDFTKRFKETEFTKYLYAASSLKKREQIWFIVLDEMNLARIEYYFADFLAILEKKPEEWIIPLVSSNEENNENQIPRHLVDKTSLFISPNIWFIGTANRDESTFGITDKVYDRAQILDFQGREEAFEGKEIEKIEMSFSEFNNLIQSAQQNSKLCLTDQDWNQLNEIDLILKDKLEITFGNRIKMQMDKFVPVYQACGGTKEEAIDYLLNHKVLRKLENRYETYLKDSLKELEQYIKLQYGEGTFKESISTINKKIDRLGG